MSEVEVALGVDGPLILDVRFSAIDPFKRCIIIYTSTFVNIHGIIVGMFKG